MGESAEYLLLADAVVGEVDRLRRLAVSLGWGELAEGAMRPGDVVVPQIVGQHLSQMVLIDDQQPVEELPAQGADEPFADRVRLRCLRRAGHDPDALRSEHCIERAGELAPARSLIRNLTEAARWLRSIRKLRAACVVHAPSGCAVMPAR